MLQHLSDREFLVQSVWKLCANELNLRFCICIVLYLRCYRMGGLSLRQLGGRYAGRKHVFMRVKFTNNDEKCLGGY